MSEQMTDNRTVALRLKDAEAALERIRELTDHDPDEGESTCLNCIAARGLGLKP